ncbi:MAG: acylphosphatase [Chloroflexota bacterium]|jgi:acylphosphatase
MPSSEPCQRLRAIVDGRVQGVGFRMFVLTCARSLNLKGWVRNRWNGEVEVLAEGTRPSLDAFAANLRSGPPAAIVLNLQLEWSEASGEFHRFEVLPTA